MSCVGGGCTGKTLRENESKGSGDAPTQGELYANICETQKGKEGASLVLTSLVGWFGQLHNMYVCMCVYAVALGLDPKVSTHARQVFYC